jgi:Phospholipase_D-nuclease N-terminal
MASKKRWGDLTPTQQGLILTLASVELAFTATALVDLARRPASQIRGPKPLWLLGCFVQPVGPLAYLVLGRRTVEQNHSFNLPLDAGPDPDSRALGH